jgi:hypothetical protein
MKRLIQCSVCNSNHEIIDIIKKGGYHIATAHCPEINKVIGRRLEINTMRNKITAVALAAMLATGLSLSAGADNLTKDTQDVTNSLTSMMNNMMNVVTSNPHLQEVANDKFGCHDDEQLMVTVQGEINLSGKDKHGDYACVKKSAVRIVDAPPDSGDKVK